MTRVSFSEGYAARKNVLNSKPVAAEKAALPMAGARYFLVTQTITMKSFMKKLLADKKLIKAIRQNKPADAYLYNLLCAGKITLQEYLMATK